MADTNWLKQTPDKPLFPDLLWSRPQNRRQAGKLLIVGGNSFGLAAPAAAYASAMAAGAGAVRVLLPEATKKSLGKGFLEADFAPSTPSGSFSRQALSALLEATEWADGVLLAGDFGRNSETAILLEKFSQKYTGQLTFASDSLDYFLANDAMTSRRHSVMVINLGRLQKLAKHNRPQTPILHSMNLHELVTTLADWANSSPAAFITKHADNFIVAVNGKVSSTPVKEESNWQVDLATDANVWWMQNPQKLFEALTTAVYNFASDTKR